MTRRCLGWTHTVTAAVFSSHPTHNELHHHGYTSVTLFMLNTLWSVYHHTAITVCFLYCCYTAGHAAGMHSTCKYLLQGSLLRNFTQINSRKRLVKQNTTPVLPLWKVSSGWHENYINYSNTTKTTYCLSTFRLHVGSLHQDWLPVPVVSM